MAKYKLLYKLTHANGALADESGSAPFEFEIGDGQLDPCLESCIKEAEVGKLRTFLLGADEAFGAVHDEAIQVMNRSEFPDGFEIKIDTAVEFKTPTNESYVGCIDKIDGNDITVNFNHPLAGCDVVFQVEVLEKS
ncbi:FKBP-type peptidyl-prolyl cis-trans isomerase [Bathymodiolus septemdierum thioautotrophic gill symbiont]|uniref:peptidylprolyl isomerase n=1 Tax=endosymbiont of Bathymodiolus septemdierum str. Myojin knoll TaxID=1303921 RepID=A0A0P0UU61_9GAMM|nr:FKBP-type peptidyl-prolyl cis-trans isomerase [Bathymodiolus septemdierum thioautotrophic gill symbiont]BAS68492.1 FKBP-type peptidyl-prolyl cis-trans isomerase SlpA [endosymbiont of Bathymodiolus septemdierum str. Myojin knoll]